jgi:flagellar biosynthesis/type III secretory pathway protein FliH
MTIAEQLRAEGYEDGVLVGTQRGVQQGIEQGLQQGVEQGLRQGVEQGEREFLLRLLKCRFGSIPDDLLEKINQANAMTLLLWGEKVLEIKDLSELFESYH